MHFPVYFDTCALYPGMVADVILRIAEEGAYSPHWSLDVLTELRRNLAKIPSVEEGGADRRIAAMQTAFPRASVDGYRGLIDSMACAEEDRHVLAAAVYAKCQVLVTYNIRDFPTESTIPHGVAVVHPDQFLLDQLDLHPRWVIRSLLAIQQASRKPRLSASALLESLARSGLAGFTAEVIRRYPINAWKAMP
ncbi:MAG: PIN domain-containing protein [Austwickia sp.]|nr:PIN domain-containing protein [Austwickia sp.]